MTVKVLYDILYKNIQIPVFIYIGDDCLKSIPKSLFWAIVFAFVIIICTIVILLNKGDAKSAVIYQDNKIIKRIDNLYPDKTEHTTIKNDDGYNKIAWYDGKIWVEKADCKNQTCVHFGKLSSSGLSIICAPHKLTIVIEDSDSHADAVT